MTVTPADVAARLKRARSASGLSSGEIANAAGIGRTTLYRYEEGQDLPATVAVRLAEIYGTTIGVLLGVGVPSELVVDGVRYVRADLEEDDPVEGLGRLLEETERDASQHRQES